MRRIILVGIGEAFFTGPDYDAAAYGMLDIPDMNHAMRDLAGIGRGQHLQWGAVN